MPTLSTLRSAHAFTFGLLISGLHAPAGALAGGPQDPGQGEGNKFKVRVLVLTTFPGETEPWLTREQWPLTFNIVGAHDPLRCQSNGICVTTTGTGKSNAGPSLTAVLHAKQLNLSNSYFVISGIAGTRPDTGSEGFKGTLGFVGIANWIVDGDLGSRFDYRDVSASDPFEVRRWAWVPVQDYENGQFHLNEQLAAAAYELTRNIPLADDATAQAARNLYPSQQGMKPFVARCDSVGADNFFAGTNAADTMDHVVRARSGGEATKCTSEFEDPAFANALRLQGKLNRLISVRSASDFETPAPGQTANQLLTAGLPGYSIAVENAYRVASRIAHALVPPGR